MYYLLCEKKTKVLISCAVTVQLICAFVLLMQKADFLMMWLDLAVSIVINKKKKKKKNNISYLRASMRHFAKKSAFKQCTVFPILLENE